MSDYSPICGHMTSKTTGWDYKNVLNLGEFCVCVLKFLVFFFHSLQHIKTEVIQTFKQETQKGAENTISWKQN